MSYDRWEQEKKELAAGFEKWLAVWSGGESVAPDLLDELRDAWVWGAINALCVGASIASKTYEGGCSCDEYDSGYSYHGENSAEEMTKLAGELADAANALPDPPKE